MKKDGELKVAGCWAHYSRRIVISEVMKKFA
jgi:hypothetical protein